MVTRVPARGTKKPDESKTTLRDRVYARLREDILRGKFPPGGNLGEIQLAEEYGVSRTPVREAIRKLAEEGLAEYFPRRGGKALRPTRELAREVFEIREALEGMAARQAATRLPAERVVEMRKRMEAIRVRIRKGELTDVGDWIHEAIYSSTGNGRLQQLASAYRGQVAWLQRAAASIEGQLERAFREHDGILSAIEAGDPDWAESASRAHVRHTLAELMAALPEDERPKRRRRRGGAQ